MCGCGSSGIDWEEFERLIEEAERESEEAPIEVTEEFAIPVRIDEEAEVE